jgi:hypothetical protein
VNLSPALIIIGADFSSIGAGASSSIMRPRSPHLQMQSVWPSKLLMLVPLKVCDGSSIVHGDSSVLIELD